MGKFVSLLFFCVNASFVILSHNLSFQPYHTLPNDYACITLSYRFDTNNPAIPAMLQDNNVAVPDLTLQQLPKSSFIPDSSFIRQFAPVYYVYTYSPCVYGNQLFIVFTGVCLWIIYTSRYNMHLIRWYSVSSLSGEQVCG